MAVKYILPCGCGESLHVDTSQAGSKIACVCGKELEVPTMRGLRDLAEVEAKGVGPREPSWSATQGGLFSGGLVLLIIGFVVFWYGYQRVSYAQPFAAVDELGDFAESLEEATPIELYAQWEAFREYGLAHRGQNQQVIARKFKRKFETVVAIGIGFAAVGLIGILASLFAKHALVPASHTG